MFSDDDGIRAVRRARRAIDLGLGAGRSAPAAADVAEDPPAFRERRGAFVTLRRHPSGELRGCIGYPLPVLPLGVAIDRAALAAATEDPRFPAVRARELPGLTVEVSVLTPPEAVPSATPDAVVASIRVGRDGLIVEGYGTSGLLLPQVATEMRWTEEELLAGTCEKAGLPADAWRDPAVRLQRFSADVFAERAPGAPAQRVVP